MCHRLLSQLCLLCPNLHAHRRHALLLRGCVDPGTARSPTVGGDKMRVVVTDLSGSDTGMGKEDGWRLSHSARCYGWL